MAGSYTALSLPDRIQDEGPAIIALRISGYLGGIISEMGGGSVIVVGAPDHAHVLSPIS